MVDSVSNETDRGADLSALNTRQSNPQASPQIWTVRVKVRFSDGFVKDMSVPAEGTNAQEAAQNVQRFPLLQAYASKGAQIEAGEATPQGVRNSDSEKAEQPEDQQEEPEQQDDPEITAEFERQQGAAIERSARKRRFWLYPLLAYFAISFGCWVYVNQTGSPSDRYIGLEEGSRLWLSGSVAQITNRGHYAYINFDDQFPNQTGSIYIPGKSVPTFEPTLKKISAMLSKGKAVTLEGYGKLVMKDGKPSVTVTDLANIAYCEDGEGERPERHNYRPLWMFLFSGSGE